MEDKPLGQWSAVAVYPGPASNWHSEKGDFIFLQATFCPSNAIVHLMDPGTGKPPTFTEIDGVVSSDSCVIIGTRSYVDGPTRITLTNDRVPVDTSIQLVKVFTGKIKAPQQRLEICAIPKHPDWIWDRLLQIHLRTTEPEVEIWMDDKGFPSEILIIADA